MSTAVRAQLGRAHIVSPVIGPGSIAGGHEVEVKFNTDKAGLTNALASPLLGAPSGLKTESLRSVYFDTPSNDLRDNGIVLRIRKNGRAGLMMGVKSIAVPGSGLFERLETEVRSRETTPDLELFDERMRTLLSDVIGERRLEAKFETEVKRRTHLIDCGHATVEVAFDEGVIAAGSQCIPLTEVELELKSGEAADLYDLAMRAAAELPLRLDFVSKAEKGFQVTNHESPAPVKADPVRLGRAATVDEAIMAAVEGPLSKFAGNWAALRETNHPEAIHQIRVALRRMRSILAIFKGKIDCPEFDILRNEAKRIATAFGPARECAVLRQSVEREPMPSAGRPPGCDTLLEAIKGREKDENRRARGVIEDRATTLFVLSLRSLLVRRAWRNALTSDGLSILTMPAKDLASESLNRLHRRVLKRGRGLLKLSDDGRHRLRIAIKNLRYSIELFDGLFDHRRRAAAALEVINQLQDLLGAQNDAASAAKLLEELSSPLGPEIQRAAGFIAGWYARGVPIAEAELARTWKEFERLKPFWQ